MPVYRDQTGREIELKQKPQRIISTVPSQTELLADLGLEAETLGITAYCVHPKKWLQEKTVIGGTKDLRLDKIRELKPDLIIGNKEENVKEQIEELAKEFPVWLSDIHSVDDALDMISSVGEITAKANEARVIRSGIEKTRAELKPESAIQTAYFIWKEPYMLAGHDSFIAAMMLECGLENIAPRNEQRYPQIEFTQLEQLNAQLLLLSSEPYSFTTSDAHALAASAKAVKIIDGELFSWYGSRMVKAFRNFQTLRKELELLF